MRIIYPWDPFQPADTIAGKNGIQVYGADKVGPLKKQVKEQLYIKACIQPAATAKGRAQSFLPEGLLC
jgi:hypothetical protein